MAGTTDLVALREALRYIVSSISVMHTHKELGDTCELLGLSTPPEAGTKYERVSASFDAVPDAQLPEVARRALVHQAPGARTRNEIQDLQWAGENHPPIPTRTRHEIAQSLNLTDLVYNSDRFRVMLRRLWVLDDGDLLSAWPGATTRLAAKIEQHVFRNPDDWSTEELFDNLGALEASDRRFALFLEGLVSPDVVPDEPTQRRIVDALNPHLRTVGVELRETDIRGGYPVFDTVSTRPHGDHRPKNLIFASRRKPDIRIRDAVNNDIDVVENADSVLIYDRAIGPGGILWRDLQTWWKETQQLQDDGEAKSSLYRRLCSSLPPDSPPQRLLYKLYHEIFGTAVLGLPALLPEVWLHWDPKTVQQRDAQALLRFRMDFLLLLPGGHRIVLEVDGTQHYAANGRPDPNAYATNMRADRDLKLSGYEVFRFGAAELRSEQQARQMLQQFFQDLFRQFHVTAN